MGNKAPVVHVPMRDDEGEQSGVRRTQAGHVRQQPDGIIRCRIGVERQAKVEQETRALPFQLDAGTADLPRSSMDADPERCETLGCRGVCGAVGRPACRMRSVLLDAWIYSVQDFSPGCALGRFTSGFEKLTASLIKGRVQLFCHARRYRPFTRTLTTLDADGRPSAVPLRIKHTRRWMSRVI